MPTDTNNAYEIVVGWRKQLATDMQRFIAEGPTGDDHYVIMDALDEPLELLEKLPLLANSGEGAEDLQPLVRAYMRGGRISASIDKCGGLARKAKRALRDLGDYEAMQALLAALRDLEALLRRTRHGKSTGNVTQLRGGPGTEDLVATGKLATDWGRLAALSMQRVILFDTWDHVYSDRTVNGFVRVVRDLTHVPLAHHGGKVGSAMDPVATAYGRGGAVAKALRRCSAAAVKVSTGHGGLKTDFSRGSSEMHEGVRELVRALDHLVAVIGKQMAA